MKIEHEVHHRDLVARVLTLQKGMSAFHWHEKFEICQLMDHDCDFLVDSEEIHAKKGDFITINEYDFHIFKPLCDDTHFRIIQYLPKIIMPSLASQHQLQMHITSEEIAAIPGLQEQLDALYTWLETECALHPSGCTELQRLYARTIYTLLARHFACAEQKVRTDRQDFYRIVEYVNDHFTQDVNVTNIARELYVSRGRLSAIFLKYAGIPLTEYIHRLRIDQVNQQLKSGVDVMTAALDSGFSSIRTFNAVYKRMMKITPTQYIKDEM